MILRCIINQWYIISCVLSSNTMPKKTPGEMWLRLPKPPSAVPIVDTHTHLASTFEAYRQRYNNGQHETVFDFARGLYGDRNVESIVDVWCEAPVRGLWREFANSAHDDRWGGIKYWFVMGEYPMNRYFIFELAHRPAGVHPSVIRIAYIISRLLMDYPATTQSTTPMKPKQKCVSYPNLTVLFSVFLVSKPCPIPAVSAGEKWASTTTTTSPPVTFNSPSSAVNSSSP